MDTRFNLAEIFTDNMVLQRNSEIRIWGSACSDIEITVEFCGQRQTTMSKDGKWSVTLLPIAAGGPYIMRATDKIGEIVLKNILVGEVWIAGGQSNMEHPLVLTEHGSREISAAFFPRIRFYNVPRRPFEDAIIDGWHFLPTTSSKASWQLCNPENAPFFSAIAFHFAKEIYQALDMPIGIIGCNWGATSASCWMSEEYLCNDEELKTYIDNYNNDLLGLEKEKYEDDFKLYLNDLKKFIKKMGMVNIEADRVDNYLMDNSAGPLPCPPLGPKSFLRPSGLYNTMLKKIIPFSIKGVLWYQGESDTNKPYLYRKLFSKMIQNWRDDWNNQNLPFIFTQLSSFNIKEDSWPILRESQTFVSENVKKTAMAITIDCGDKNNIHPSNKQPVGKRLALLARNKVYGQEVECTGPTFRDMKVHGNKIILSFDCISKGLTSRGMPLKGFKICDENKKFMDANAEIKEDTIVVYCDEIKSPVAVSYGWAGFTDANLYNTDDLPAIPFRTDRI